MFQKNALWILPLFLFVIISGCSSGSPIEPNISVQPDSFDDSFPLILSEGDDSSISAGRGLMGAFNLVVNTEALSAELVPIRTALKEGDSFLTKLSYYFTAVPCKDCLRIESVAVNAQNDVVLTFKTTHPFGIADPLQPPSSRNRDDLRVFDVKLLYVMEGETEFAASGITLNPGVVVNADGYSHIEDSLFDSTNDIDTNAYPYIILAEDSSVGNVDPTNDKGFANLAIATGHNVLNQGQSYSDDMILHLPYGQTITATLVMFGCYGQSSFNWEDRLTPQYWLPEFNIKEPWKVEVSVPTNNLNDAMASSSANVEIKIWDWQHSTTKIDDNLIDLDAIKTSSEITNVSVEIPGVTFKNATSDTPSGGTGIDNSPLVYQVEVKNDLLADAGSYWGLVKATDSRQQGQNYGSIGELVEYTQEDNTLHFTKIYEFATYQVFPIDIADAGGSECGPITVRMQYGETGGMGFLTNLNGTVLHFIHNSEMKIKALASIPGGAVTNIDFDFDNPDFDDQSSTDSTITRTYSNPNCGSTNQTLELKLTITITDDCAASADWQKEFTIFVYCGEECGPMIAGSLQYSQNGSPYETVPMIGLTIQHGDEIGFKATGFTSTNASIEKYTFDFDNPAIDDKTQSGNTLTRIITNPNCTPAGAEKHLMMLDITVEDDCEMTNDLTKSYKVYVECPADCGPIGEGLFEYSLDGTFFTPVTSSLLSVVNGAEVSFKATDFVSPNATISSYTFDFDNPEYDDQTGTSDTITRVFNNDNCDAGFGDPEFVGLTVRIEDDCAASLDLIESFDIQIICAPCYGTGLSFTQNHRLIAGQAGFSNLDITKKGGGGMKLADGGDNKIYAGYLGIRNSDSAPGIGFARTPDNGGSWPLSNFIPTSTLPGGFSIVTDDALIIVVTWFDSAAKKIYIERSANGGIVFERSEIYSGSQNISCISLAQDPIDPTRIYLLFVEDNDSTGTSNSIKLLSSANTGESFPSGSFTIVANSSAVYDRSFSSADIIISPVNGNLYVCASQNAASGSNAFIARSTNQGTDFSAGAKLFSNSYNENIYSIDIAITDSAPDGQAVYVAFAQGNASKGAVKLIRGNTSIDSFSVVNSAINDTTNNRPYEAGVATDSLGNVYVVWSDDRGEDDLPDIYADYSRDNGFSFGDDKIVNDSSPGSAVRTSPEIIVSESSCEIIVIYEDNSSGGNTEIYSRVG